MARQTRRHRRRSAASWPALTGLSALAALTAITALTVSAFQNGLATTARAATPGPQLPEIVTRETQAAIEKGLEYLVRTQRNDGSWTVSSSYRGYSTVMTSLAGMALMANGSTPEEGPYARQVTRAMNYVLKHSRPADGLIASAGSGRSMYGHGFSMLFLAQCYGVDVSPQYERRIHDALTKAVQLTARSQSDLGERLHHAGGWYYSPDVRNDEGSVTITQLQALRACRNVGITVPTSTIDRAVAYLRHCQVSDGGICYAANSRGAGRPAISAAALACFYAAGVYDRQAGGAGPEAKMVERLWQYMQAYGDPGKGEQQDVWGHWFYLHYYYAQAVYQRGGPQWPRYYRSIDRALRQRQNIDGSWSGGVGTSYRTAIACIILQLPYGYLPIYQR